MSSLLHKTDSRIGKLRRSTQQYIFWVLLFVGLVVIPLLYYTGQISIEKVNMLGRYMTFAIVAVGLDLVWGYTGILSLCQAFFFSLPVEESGGNADSSIFCMLFNP